MADIYLNVLSVEGAKGIKEEFITSSKIKGVLK